MQSNKHTKRVLLHLHIGKNGGTSLDGLGRKLAQLTSRQFVGYRHFDWSFLEDSSFLDASQHQVDVITMLRHPVERATSHFLSAQIWMPQLRHDKKNLTLGDYLRDTNLLLSTRTIWVDGQAGVLWLTGTHTEDWVVPHLNASELSRRQELYTNHTAELCLLAADRLDQTLWFGILEHVNKSMVVLQHALWTRRNSSTTTRKFKSQACCCTATSIVGMGTTSDGIPSSHGPVVVRVWQAIAGCSICGDTNGTICSSTTTAHAKGVELCFDYQEFGLCTRTAPGVASVDETTTVFHVDGQEEWGEQCGAARLSDLWRICKYKLTSRQYCTFVPHQRHIGHNL